MWQHPQSNKLKRKFQWRGLRFFWTPSFESDAVGSVFRISLQFRVFAKSWGVHGKGIMEFSRSDVRLVLLLNLACVDWISISDPAGRG